MATTTVPLVRPAGEWGSGPGWARTGFAVRVDTDAGARLLRLAPGAVATLADLPPGRGTMDGELGSLPLTLAATKSPTKNIPEFPLRGYVGADWMAEKTLGFDPATSTLHVWTKGLTEDEAKAWVGKDAEVDRLEELPDGRLVQTVELDGLRKRFLLTGPEVPPMVRLSESPANAIDVGRLPALSGTGLKAEPGRASLKASATARRLDWYLYGTSPEVKGPLEPDGSLPIFEGTTGRCVLDFRGRRFVARPASLDERIAEELGRVVRVPLLAKGGHFVVAAAGSMDTAQAREAVGGRLVELDGFDFASIIGDWRSGKRKGVFEWLARWRREGLKATMLTDEVKNEGVRFPIDPDSLLQGG